MKLARAAAIGSVLAASLSLGTPAMANNTEVTSVPGPSITLKSYTNTGFSQFRTDYTVHYSKAVEKRESQSRRFDRTTLGKISQEKLDDLWTVILSDGLASEAGEAARITCPDDEEPTYWTLASTANDKRVSEYTCGRNVLPSKKANLAKAAKLIASSDFSQH